MDEGFSVQVSVFKSSAGGGSGVSVPVSGNIRLKSKHKKNSTVIATE